MLLCGLHIIHNYSTRFGEDPRLLSTGYLVATVLALSMDLRFSGGALHTLTWRLVGLCILYAAASGLIYIFLLLDSNQIHPTDAVLAEAIAPFVAGVLVAFASRKKQSARKVDMYGVACVFAAFGLLLWQVGLRHSSSGDESNIYNIAVLAVLYAISQALYRPIALVGRPYAVAAMTAAFAGTLTFSVSLWRGTGIAIGHELRIYGILLGFAIAASQTTMLVGFNRCGVVTAYIVLASVVPMAYLADFLRTGNWTLSASSLALAYFAVIAVRVVREARLQTGKDHPLLSG